MAARRAQRREVRLASVERDGPKLATEIRLDGRRGELLARTGELPKDERIVAHGSSGIPAGTACRELKGAGCKAGS